MAGLFYISTFIDLSDHLFKGTATTGMLFAYFWWSTPQFVYYIIAIAVLLAAVVTIGALTKSSELIVMRACGISLYRTAVPLLVAAAGASLVLFALEERLLAPANRRASELSHLIRGQSPRTFDVLNRKWLTGEDGVLYHYQFYNPRRQELNGLTVLRFDPADPGRIATRVFADHGIAGAGRARSAALDRPRRLDAARSTRRWPSPRSPASARRTLTLDPPETFVTEAPPPSQMNYGQLRTYIRDLRASGYDVREDEVALHRKIAFPLRHAGDDADRRPVRRHHRPARRALRGRRRHRAGARLLDDDQRLRRLRRRRRDAAGCSPPGRPTSSSAPSAVYLLLTVRT